MRHLLTPQDYSNALHESFSKTPGFVLKDLFVIPDYDSYFKGCPDPKFGTYCKKENAQLQFTFEAVDVSEHFPLGCKTTYRAYSQDLVVEIYQEETPNMPGINLMARSCQVRTYPEGDSTNGTPAGMFILYKLPPPDRQVEAMQLVFNSRALLDEVVVDIEKSYQKFQPKIVEDWKTWATTFAPENDDVTSFNNK